MMLFKTLLLALTTFLITTALGAPSQHMARDPGLDKPTIEPPAPNLDWHLTRLLKGPIVEEVKFWDNGKINQQCKDVFQKNGFKIEDILMFHVHYSDCYLPWTMCAHKAAQWTAPLIALNIGLIPPNMRVWIRHVIALPGEARTSALNFSVLIHGQATMQDIFASAAPGFGQGIMGDGKPYWAKQPWLDAYAADSAVLNDKAKANQKENFAQMNVVAMAEFENPGCWKDAIPQLEKLRHQVDVIKTELGRYFNTIEGVKCEARWLVDTPVGLPEELPDYGA
ncbi:hypothetical protein CC86DRAFT_470325 [Ophiobolus disseminans]|uniref:Uncharacterized protein n=1 Tax=Ophiobolus disseminans TaxID=1469910 RepID=A0A6A6ZMX2_9PLEO|nr:hypothetical protein CC86DRAFT_470325 [Ophiobolus disseminans]